MTYVHDLSTKVWSRPDRAEFPYSDGQAIEDSLLAILRNAKDVCSLSLELAKAITDWPNTYHLSPVRHNLLRFLPLSASHNVLELGCGCGAMTRYLAEAGANITAVEGSMRRAQIVAERCRDLRNVRVVCDDLMHFETEQRFDYVTLIGVIEYAPRYIQAEDPVVACLEKARSFMKPDGLLILAIENQLGLKYFNGCAEDHLGAAYYGLHGLYRTDDPTTFGRATLEQKLAAAGLLHQRFFYPFPDYKLPSVMLSDSAFSTPSFDAAGLLAGMASRDAEGKFHPSFYENLAWRPIIDNGLLPHLANSFLILAAVSDEALHPFDSDWLACVYTTDRIPAYATETRFRHSSTTIVVQKRPLYPDVPTPKATLPEGRLLHRAATASNYVIGHPYLLELQQALGRGEGAAAAIEWAAPWLNLLLAHATITGNTVTLPGAWIDAIPQNFIRTADGSLRSIDDEWAIEGTVPLTWVIIRGLINALAISPTSTALDGLSTQELVVAIAASRGIAIEDTAFLAAATHEASLQSIVRANKETDWLLHIETLLRLPPCSRLNLTPIRHYCQQLRRHIAFLETEIGRAKSTFSWQITKPLRLLANLPRMARERFSRTQER